MRELICITCPKGCHLKVDEENDYKVTGNGCPRGAIYGKKECTHPTRVVTSTVKIVVVKAPVHREDVIVHDICGTGVDLVATKDL